jgi:ferredoxin--NADP+ reductase
MAASPLRSIRRKKPPPAAPHAVLDRLMIEAAANKPARSPNAPTEETVLSVNHYTDRMFAFRITRPGAFRFRSGEFVMIGLEGPNGKPILRAYSVASPSWDEELEFFSIKVADGPLTSKLQLIKPGDKVLLGRKPTGTLVHDALTPGKRLYLFSTGTGIAPFASIIRDPETYERFEQVILTHTCREVGELKYGQDLVAALKDDPLVGEYARRLIHYTTVTREPWPNQNRITKCIETGLLFADLEVSPLNPATDRVMICGSLDMLTDTKALVEKAGLREGSNAEPAEFVIEKAFVG